MGLLQAVSRHLDDLVMDEPDNCDGVGRFGGLHRLIVLDKVGQTLLHLLGGFWEPFFVQSIHHHNLVINHRRAYRTTAMDQKILVVRKREIPRHSKH